MSKLLCGCGEPVIVTDDNGSIGCSADCGWMGIELELEVAVVKGEDIKWVS